MDTEILKFRENTTQANGTLLILDSLKEDVEFPRAVKAVVISHDETLESGFYSRPTKEEMNEYMSNVLETYQVISATGVRADFPITGNFVVFKGHRLADEEITRFKAEKHADFYGRDAMLFTPYQMGQIEEFPKELEYKPHKLLEWFRNQTYTNFCE